VVLGQHQTRVPYHATEGLESRSDRRSDPGEPASERAICSRRAGCARLGGDMTGADRPSDVGAIIYVDRSDVHEDCLNELKVGIRALVAFVDAHQPQMAMYGIYLDEQAHRMTVVSRSTRIRPHSSGTSNWARRSSANSRPTLTFARSRCSDS